MHRGQRQLAVARLEDAEVGDDDADVVADARREVELLDEGALRVAEHHEHILDRCGDLGRTTAAGQAHLRLRVVADHRAVEVAAAVDLRRAEEADVDAAALEPVREHLRHGDDRVRRLGELAVADRQRQMLGLRADRAALVDEHAAGSVRPAREVRGEARQPDADEADGVAREPPRRLDGHHLVRRVAVFGHVRGTVPRTWRSGTRPRDCPWDRDAWYSSTSAVSSTCCCIHERKPSRSRLIASHAT